MEIEKYIETKLNCTDTRLIKLVIESINIFNNLDENKNYTIAFSGGKDSHALLICFLLWKDYYKKNTDNFTIKFADTGLEINELYKIIYNIKDMLVDVKFIKTKPFKSYWYYQFIYGYAVPDYKIRWCTSSLKIDPLKKGGHSLQITGRHFGESINRDNKLNKCGSIECGVDKIAKSIDPIINFSNCDVWDLIFYADDNILYKNVFTYLQSMYSASTDNNGSLRMGCMMCPVISINTLEKHPKQNHGLEFRMLLEELRKCIRINNPKNKLGAIHIKERRKIWDKFDKDKLLTLNYIQYDDLININNNILNDYSYPPSYSKDHIDSEHFRLKHLI